MGRNTVGCFVLEDGCMFIQDGILIEFGLDVGSSQDLAETG